MYKLSIIKFFFKKRSHFKYISTIYVYSIFQNINLIIKKKCINYYIGIYIFI